MEAALTAFRSQDYTRARKLLQPLAEQGNTLAQCLLGNIYQLGLGIEADHATAISWYRKSAEQGYGLASSNLAGMLSDPEEVNYWYQKAREQGFTAQPYYADESLRYLCKPSVRGDQQIAQLG